MLPVARVTGHPAPAPPPSSDPLPRGSSSFRGPGECSAHPGWDVWVPCVRPCWAPRVLTWHLEGSGWILHPDRGSVFFMTCSPSALTPAVVTAPDALFSGPLGSRGPWPQPGSRAQGLHLPLGCGPNPALLSRLPPRGTPVGKPAPAAKGLCSQDPLPGLGWLVGRVSHPEKPGLGAEARKGRRARNPDL